MWSNRRHLAVIALILIIVMAGSATIAAAPPGQDATPAPPQPLVGQASYLANCAPCHGTTGQGDGAAAAGLTVPPTALGSYGGIAARSWQALFEVTKNGNMQRMMPPWKNQLSDQEIWDTVAYAWTLHTSAEELATGTAVYSTNCAACHGLDGVSLVASTPDLADFSATSSVSQAVWAELVANGKGTMPGFSGKLGEPEQRAALVYARSLSLGGPLFREPVAEGAGVISGTVTNGTTGQPVAGATIELGIFDAAAMLEQRTATTDSAGVYTFTGLPTASGIAFAARVEYPAGVPYSTDFAGFEAGQAAMDLPVAVYEITDDPSGVRAERVHFIVEVDPTLPGQASIAELIVFSLDGDRTYVGDANGVLSFPLPAGATELAINEDEIGGRFQTTSGGFVDLLPLRPGQNVRQVLYRYTLPYAGDTLDLKRTLPYPAANINALVSDVGQQVTSPQLADMGRRTAQNSSYFNLVGVGLPAGQEIAIRITKLPTTGAAATPLNPGLLLVLVGLAAAIAAALVALPMLRGRAAPVQSGSSAGPVTQSDLLDALADLDLAHEAGDLPDGAYRDRRLRLKAQLRDLLAKEGQE